MIWFDGAMRRSLLSAAGAIVLALPIAASPMLPVASVTAQSRREPEAEQFVNTQANRVLAVLNSRSMPLAQKQQTFRGMIDQVADIPRITDFVLGKYNRTIAPAQKQEFTTLFRAFANNVWESRLGEYGGEKLIVTGSIVRAPGDVVVTSSVTGGQLRQPSDVNWRVLRRQDGSWRAVDVQIQGVWLAITQQQDFVSTIDNAGGNVGVLLAQLRTQVAQQTAAR